LPGRILFARLRSSRRSIFELNPVIVAHATFAIPVFMG